MKWLDQYLAASRRGDERAQDAVGAQPLTCIFGMVAVLSIPAALVYAVAFADYDHERWVRAWHSLPFVTLAFLLYFIVNSLEQRSLVPLAIRRFAWYLMFYGYFGAVILVLLLGLSPYSNRGTTFPLLARIGMCAPIPAYAWYALRKNKDV
jgi:hypothetical protein